MGIKATFSKADVRRMMETKRLQIEQAIINRLKYIGETFVRNARQNHTYLDQTGNLTASISFIVLNNGRTVTQNFEGKPDGIRAAKGLIEELRSGFLTGYVLIVVAGMDYAAAVESRGKDVLTASSITAKNDLKRAIKELKNNIR